MLFGAAHHANIKTSFNLISHFDLPCCATQCLYGRPLNQHWISRWVAAEREAGSWLGLSGVRREGSAGGSVWHTEELRDDRTAKHEIGQYHRMTLINKTVDFKYWFVGVYCIVKAGLASLCHRVLQRFKGCVKRHSISPHTCTQP